MADDLKALDISDMPDLHLHEFHPTSCFGNELSAFVCQSNDLHSITNVGNRAAQIGITTVGHDSH